MTPLSGDRIAQWMRWIHEGSNAGMLWRAIVFVCGVVPAIFAVTGALIWLRSRARRKAARGVKASAPLDATADNAYR